jgi:hypothetical protein
MTTICRTTGKGVNSAGGGGMDAPPHFLDIHNIIIINYSGEASPKIWICYANFKSSSCNINFFRN